MILRDLAEAWLRANCPHPEVRQDFLNSVDRAIELGVGCPFLLGGNLTKHGKPMLVYGYCGELFAFQLTTRQATSLNMDDETYFAAGRLNQVHTPNPAPLFRIEHVEVDNAGGLSRTAPITGTLTYRTEQWWMLPMAVQVVCLPPRRGFNIHYHHFDNLPSGQHSVRFSLSPLGDRPDKTGQPIAGVLPMFFQLCLAEEPETDPFAAMLPPGIPKPPSMPPFPPMPPLPTPELGPKVNDAFVPPGPMPTVVTAKRDEPHRPTSWTPIVPTVSSPPKFRAVSDVRAALAEVV